MGRDKDKLLWDGNGTDKYVPWTTLAVPLVSQLYDVRCAVSTFSPRIDQLVEGKQKQKSH